MDFQKFIDTHRTTKTNQDIEKRWQSRIVASGLEKQGQEGAVAYINRYSPAATSAEKYMALANCATNHGFPKMALGFWARAYEMIEGHRPETSAELQVSENLMPSVQKDEKIQDNNFPESLQPGAFLSMQPSDAKHTREYYIKSSEYWGQPKRNGHKLIVFASPIRRYYQNRSMRLRQAPSKQFDNALAALVEEWERSFIVEGELYFTVNDVEYLTEAEATAAAQGREVKMHYGIFHAVWLEGEDLRVQSERVACGQEIAEALSIVDPVFEQIFTAKTEFEKEWLCDFQLDEGNEGEIWLKPAMKYFADKGTKENEDYYVRTKYAQPIVCYVKGLTKTTAPDKVFGAILIEDDEGNDLGSIGTGFTRQQEEQLFHAWSMMDKGQRLAINVLTRGWTSGGKLNHASYKGIAAPVKVTQTDLF